MHALKDKYYFKNIGNSLAVQWLGLCTLTAEGPGSIPGQGTKIPGGERHGQKTISNLPPTPEMLNEAGNAELGTNRTALGPVWGCGLRVKGFSG